MKELKFNDFYLSKYNYTGEFHEGLAVVRNRSTGLYGYINKKGEEVIPCQYREANNFSCGLACVKNLHNLCGYIDKKGNQAIEYQYKKGEEFSENIAAVQLCDDTYEYITTTGITIGEERYREALPFSNGYAVVERLGLVGKCYINTKGKISRPYYNAGSFENGIAVVAIESHVLIIDTDFNILARIDRNAFKSIYAPTEGLIPVEMQIEEYGYLNDNLEVAISADFSDIAQFSEGIARVEMGPEWHGYINKTGKVILAFSKRSQYQCLNSFYDGLALVEKPCCENKYGYINKKGEEVIPCQYREADNFSEGLAGVITMDHRWCYIDKKGNIKIRIPDIYCSVIELDDKTITIEAQSKEELESKKLQVLKLIKTELLSKIENEIDQMAYDETSDLVEREITRTRKPNNQ